MAEAGILRASERVELLDGALVEMSPIGGPHWTIDAVLVPYLATRLTGRALVAGQASVALGDFDEPQPDILIVPPTPGKFARTGPEPGDILAIIEIADTSLGKDTTIKRLLYERVGIRDYLVVDVGTQTVLHFRLNALGYGEPARLGRGEYLSLEAFHDVRLDVDPFLSPREWASLTVAEPAREAVAGELDALHDGNQDDDGCNHHRRIEALVPVLDPEGA